jgi:hypothetical protein
LARKFFDVSDLSFGSTRWKSTASRFGMREILTRFSSFSLSLFWITSASTETSARKETNPERFESEDAEQQLLVASTSSSVKSDGSAGSLDASDAEHRISLSAGNELKNTLNSFRAS